MDIFDKLFKKQAANTVVPQETPKPAAQQTPRVKSEKVDLAEFTAKERKLMDDALTFMANLAATGGIAKVGFSLSSYHKAIPQLVEVNPQYRVHKEELLQDYSLHMPDLIRRMTELL
jgi:hypothetical protein